MNAQPLLYIKNKGISAFTICAAAVLIALIILLLACFAAFTYASAQDKLEQSEQKQQLSDEYYAAEATATSIISEFFCDKRELTSDLNGREICESDQGDITVTKIDNKIYFAVPAGDDMNLQVEATVTKSDIQIDKWYLSYGK